MKHKKVKEKKLNLLTNSKHSNMLSTVDNDYETSDMHREQWR